MFKVLKLLVTGVGIPFLANQFRSLQEEAPKTSLAILIASYLTKKRKEIIQTALLAVLGTVLIGCGSAFLLYTWAQSADFNGVHSFQTSYTISTVILLVGAAFDTIVWKKMKDMEMEFEQIARTNFGGEQKGSFFKNVILNILRSLAGDQKAFQR